MLEELTRQPGWAVFTDYIRYNQGIRQGHLVNGAAKDFAGYREEVGWLKGVNFALKVTEDVQKLVQAEAARRAADQDAG